MIVNKSMYPVQTGFGVISKMQDRFATLQMQLGTGMKASTLAEMGRDLPMSLSVRSRLDKIEGFSANIDTVNLRLSFLDKTLSRFDKIEGEARNSATQGQYGTNNINMATLPGLSQARFDEMVTLLNSEVAGRYLFGGSVTDKAPLPTTTSLLEGQGGKDGFKTVVSERKAADAGANGMGRVNTDIATGSSEVSITEDGMHPFGFKLLRVTSTASPTAVDRGTVGASDPVAPGDIQTGNTTTIKFSTDPTDQIKPGQSITLGLQLPDGLDTQITLTAISADDAPAGAGQFVVTADPAANAASFKAALDKQLETTTDSELAAASTFAASEMFFNGPGEPALRVDGNPATSQGLRLATATDTVQWYSGQTPAVSAEGMGRLGVAVSGDVVTLSETAPASTAHGFQISAATVTPPANVLPVPAVSMSVGHTATNPSSTTVQMTSNPQPGETVSLTLTEPNGTIRQISLTAVQGKAGAGQFSIGTDKSVTAENFASALTNAATAAAKLAEGNPRQTVSAQVDDSTRVNYGIQANESGLLRLMRTTAAMSVETYPDSDPSSLGRFDAMSTRQRSELSESHNSESGSVEILTLELSVAVGTLDNASKRHTDYQSQLTSLLSDVETISKEDVAMEILALQTRMQASYQTTAMVAKLSLVNYL